MLKHLVLVFVRKWLHSPQSTGVRKYEVTFGDTVEQRCYGVATVICCGDDVDKCKKKTAVYTHC